VKIVFCVSLIGIFYVYVGYPAAIWLLARLHPRPWKAAPITPSVSIVLAVHNGVLLLPRKNQNLPGLDYPNNLTAEIWLVDRSPFSGRRLKGPWQSRRARRTHYA
jgi:hypothetical protein